MPPTDENKAQRKQKTEALMALTDAFAEQYLDSDYRALCQKLILKLSRKRDVPFLRGRLEIWAAAIIHALGTINFLFDKSFEPSVSAGLIADHFGAALSTINAKSKQIRELFKLRHFDSAFSVGTVAESNPFNHLVTINGLIQDIRGLPPEIQGLIQAHPGQSFELEIEEIDAEDQAFFESIRQRLGLEPQDDCGVSLPLLARFDQALRAVLPEAFVVSHDRFLYQVIGLCHTHNLESGLQFEARRRYRPQAGRPSKYAKPKCLPIHEVEPVSPIPLAVAELLDDYLTWFLQTEI